MDKNLPKKIWLAGLGALARAEEEGESWLNDLMKEGEEFEQAKKEEIQQAVLEMGSKLKETKQHTKQRFENIEKTFETKISEALGHIGLASKDEVTVLKSRLQELEEKLTEITNKQQS